MSIESRLEQLLLDAEWIVSYSGWGSRAVLDLARSVKALVAVARAAKALNTKMDRIVNSSEFVSVFNIAELHGAPYQGGIWGGESETLREALRALESGGEK